ncbi:MAG: DegT/DnrJ/EryC1/StrS family aminotransferase, partial [Patescibacteria group bacterium]
MIPLVKSTFFNERKTKEAICQFILKQDKLSFGAECERFEKAFGKWQQRTQCVFLNSGSSANLAIIQTLLNLGMLKRGDYVGFSTLTWSTNVMPLIQLGLHAVPIDV